MAGESKPDIEQEGFVPVAGDSFDAEEYYRTLHLNPEELSKGNNVDIMSQQLGDSGNEATLSALNEMASTSGGELGKMRTLERDVDQSMQARTGDRSFNLSENKQEVHKAKFDGEMNDADPIGENWNSDEVLTLDADVESLLGLKTLENEAKDIAALLETRGIDVEHIFWTFESDADIIMGLVEIAKANDLDDIAHHGFNVLEVNADAGNDRALEALSQPSVEDMLATIMPDPQPAPTPEDQVPETPAFTAPSTAI